MVAMGALTFSACADTEPGSIVAPDASQIATASDASDAPADAPCTRDCEFFPPVCTDDIFCPNGLFDPAKPGGGPDSFDVRTTVHLIRGRSASDVWVVGALGALTHFDGTSWVRVALPIGGPSPKGRMSTLRTLWLGPDYEVGIEGLKQIYSRGLVDPPDAGGDWTDNGALNIAAPRINPASLTVTSGWASPGEGWFWLSTGPLTNAATTPSGLIRVRVGDPGSFTGEIAATTTGTLNDLHGASADDFWAVGMNGTAVRVTGASGDSPSIKAYDSQTRNALYGVWAASASDVWAVGFDGTIRHYTGDPLRWEIVSDVPAGAHLNAVWGSSSSDIWAVGQDAVVLHYDGTRWSRVKIAGLGERRPDLVTVWTAGPGHVWIGGHGVVLSLGGKP